MIEQWKRQLAAKARPEKIAILSRFFKTRPGEYGHGDIFIGLSVPDNRAISKEYADAPPEVICGMLAERVHEHRLAALLALVARYRRNPEETVKLYLSHLRHINNWDLVDLSAPYIIGEELRHGRHIDTVAAMASDANMWARRVAVVSTLRPVMKSASTQLALSQCARLVDDSHPLMRKAVGWVLREVGKKDLQAMLAFIGEHIATISATTLSYATERLPRDERILWRQRRKEAHTRQALT